MAYKIKELRERKKLTQSMLSKKSGVSRAIISKLENEEKVVTTTETLRKLAKALDCTVGEIFFEEKI